MPTPAPIPLEPAVTEALSARQQAVLDTVLALMVEAGDQLTMDAVARRASCSKETLYKWFGGRDGLLGATVRWQASRVRADGYATHALDAGNLRASLEDFARTWLTVVTSPTSVALNRMAIGHAGVGKAQAGKDQAGKNQAGKGQTVKDKASEGHVDESRADRAGRDAARANAGHLGAIVLAQGRFAIGARVKPLLEAARVANLLAFADSESAFRTFLGLVGRDIQIRLLLGEAMTLDAADIRRDAAEAVAQFLTLYGPEA